MTEKILLLDFGASYNQFIIKKLRDFGVYTEMVDHDIKASEISKDKSIIGIILSGSPSTVYLDDGLLVDPEIFDLDIPVLGICYGMQLMAHQLGGKVEAMELIEKGYVDLDINSDNALLTNATKVYMDHGDHVTRLPDGFINHGHTQKNKYSLISNIEKGLYATQFHPEKDESKVLETFAKDICNARRDWTLNKYLEDQVALIKKIVKDKKVLLGLSGGFKSSLTAVILHQAIGNQLICVTVDSGLLINKEPLKAFKENYDFNIIEIEAKERFFKKLKNITHPEDKRKVIAKEFNEIFNELKVVSQKIEFLALGSLYSDVLESGNHKTNKFVKTHYSVNYESNKELYQLINPLKPLFKDEAKKLAEIVGLTKSLINQEPFPIEGLSIRIIGEITKDKIRIVKESDKILRDELQKVSLIKDNTQYYTILTDTKSVVGNDFKRCHEYVIAINAVYSSDGILSEVIEIPYETLKFISYRISNEVQGISRVVMDITNKPNSKIEWE